MRAPMSCSLLPAAGRSAAAARFISAGENSNTAFSQIGSRLTNRGNAGER
jgi:hypothetical protein